MYKIIVASHGPMAEGMKKSLEFVMEPDVRTDPSVFQPAVSRHLS